MAMDAILATIANGQRVIVNINREAGKNKLFFHLFYYLILNPSKAASAKPFHRGSQGWGIFLHKSVCAV
jgi:hypothetical protein